MLANNPAAPAVRDVPRNLRREKEISCTPLPYIGLSELYRPLLGLERQAHPEPSKVVCMFRQTGNNGGSSYRECNYLYEVNCEEIYFVIDADKRSCSL